MKIIILFLSLPFIAYSQVGINTINPQAMLDVEGDIRIATLLTGTESAAKDSILVVDGNHIVRKVDSKAIFSNLEKSLVKGVLNTGSTISISSGNTLIPFNSTEFDIKSEFDTYSSEFVASGGGIYKVHIQIKQDIVSVGDLGLSIYKVDMGGNESLISRERYTNLNLLGLSLSAPTRQTSTLVQLNSGEKIRFKINTVVNLNISALSSDTYFTIEQLR